MKAIVPTNARALFELLMDVDTIETWAYGVSDAQLVKHLEEGADLLYLYSDIPWPVRDRDMVVERVGFTSPDQQTFRISWRCASKTTIKAPANVLRVRSCESEFLIRRIDDNNASLDYRVAIDPAGALPPWASRWFARNAPGETLARILRRVEQLGRSGE